MFGLSANLANPRTISTYILKRWGKHSRESYSDLEGPRDMRVLKTASEVPSTTPTAMIAGLSSQCWG